MEYIVKLVNYVKDLNKISIFFTILIPFISYFVGVLIERFILPKLKRLAYKTKWEGDEIFVTSFKGIISLWFALFGVYILILAMPLKEKVFSFLSKFLIIISIFSVIVLLNRITIRLIRLYANKAKGSAILPSVTLLINVAKLIIYVLGVLITLNALGISITPLLTGLGIGGLAVALALKDTLSNLFAGLHIIVAKPIKPGDYIELDNGVKGYVADINWRNTIVRPFGNNEIIIPNSTIANSIITNYFLPEKKLSVVIQVGVSYDSDLEKVEKVTIEVAKEVLKEVDGGVPDFEPFIRYHTFSDSSINFSVILYAKEYVNKFLVKHEFIKRLHKRYNQEGIEIPFPITTVYLKNNSGGN